MNRKKLYLTLQNGKVLQGYAFGAEGEITGELVFSTGMVGYIETLTDPASFGQMVVQTFPLIGNYGMIEADKQSDKAWASAYVVREICEAPSNFRTDGSLEDYLKEQGVVGICGVDTRELTKILREEGAMNARISKKPLKETEFASLKGYKIENAVERVAKKEKGYFAAEEGQYTVALWNFGAKHSVAANLNAQGWNVISLPADTTAEEALSLEVDGVVLSDGPGNPADNESAIGEIRKLLGKKPVFGLGLGHQLLALAAGGKTVKCKYGHRGSNQPVKSVEDGRVYISTQNHGYEVIASSLSQGKVSFINVNDGSCEGVVYEELRAMSTQFEPEACSIGVPVNPVYEQFRAMMEKEKENA